MPNVFISYRRSDTTSGYASWLYSELRDELGPESVFMDVDSIPYGADFVAHLQSELERCDVALVLIGPNWLDATDDDGKRRLDDPADFVHVEVANVLQMPGVKVIPVLVDGATMPTTEMLPPELESLTRRQALEFHRSGGSSIGQLLTAIGGAEKRPAARSRRPLLLGGAALAAAGLIAALVVALTDSGGSAKSNAAPPPSGSLKTFRGTSEGDVVTFKYPAALQATTLRPDPGKPPTFRLSNADEAIIVQDFSTDGPAPGNVNESEPSKLLKWFRSTVSSAQGYHQLSAPAPVAVPSAFMDSALEWTYSDVQGKHAVYVSTLGADGWIVSAQAPSLQTATADGSTVFNSMSIG